MNKVFTSFLLFLLFAFNQQAHALISISVTGNTNTVPSLAATYVSLSSAVSALNSVTAINGPVTFNMASGTTESATAQITLTQAGSSLYPIIFQKSGVSANPKLTRTDAGANATAGAGGFGDGVLRIDGTDNITFNGLDIAASNQGIEYGYYVHKPNATNGSQNLTIKNATVTMTKGTSAYVTGIYVDNGQTSLTLTDGLTITALSGRSVNITIIGNTIQNVHRGIYCYGYFGYYLLPNYMDQDINIGQSGAGNGNTVINFGGGAASEASGIFCWYFANTHVENNTVNNMSGGIAATSTLYGINLSYSMGISSVSNNTITLNNTTGEADWIRFYSYGYANSFPTRQVQVHNNTFIGSVGSASNSSMILFTITASNVNISARNNNTSGTITKGGIGGNLYGYNNSTNSNMVEHVAGNNFSNMSNNGSCIGIASSAGSNDTCYIDSNTVVNLTSTNISSSSYGIQLTDPTMGFVRDNTIGNINANFVRGISLNASSYGVDVQILRNKIHTLNSIATSTSDGVVKGIYIYNYAEPGQVKIYNNLMGNFTAPTSNALNAISGIDLSCSNMTTPFSTDIAHNTIYFNAASSALNFGTSGISEYVSTTSSAFNRLLLRNNIIVNTSTPSGTGVTTAFRRSGLLTTTYDPSSNRNLFYTGIPSANKLIFTNGTNVFSLLNDYQSYLMSNIPAAERNSISEMPVFTSITGSSADFLKFDTTLPTGIESGASMIQGITNDVVSNLRAGQPAYAGTGLAPDLGAWELNGTLLSPCTGTPAAATAYSSNANPCTDSLFAVYTDPLYGNGTAYQWQKSTTDSSTGFVNISGANESYFNTSIATDTWYRCQITCLQGNQSILSSAVFVNVTPLSGTYLISNTGSGQYLNFTAAIADLNCRSAEGPVTFEVADGQTFNETVDLSIRYTGSFPVTFKKQGNGTNPIIQRSGTSSTSNFILELNGADHINFDGIDFTQTGTANASWVEYGIHITNQSPTNGSQYNTFRNGTITLTTGSVNTIGVYLHSASNAATTQSGTNSHNRFANMTIQTAFQGYRFYNTSNVVFDDSNEVVGENGLLGNINSLGNGITSANIYGINATDQQHFKVDSVDIYGIQATSLSYGIYSESSDSTSTLTLSNNHIHFNSSTSSFLGISVFSQAHVYIRNNEINEIASSNTSSSSVIGMNLSCEDSTFVYNNKIYNLSITGTSTYTFGMRLYGAGNFRVFNNMLSDLRAGTSGYYPAAVAGVHVEYGTANKLQLYNNSFYLTDVGSNASYRSACIVSADSNTLFDLRNNLFINASNVNSGALAMGFMKTHSGDNIATTCNNNLWYSGIPDAKHLIYYCTTPTTAVQTLASYKAQAAVAPAENESVTGVVNIIPSLSGDIRPNSATPCLAEGRAQVLSSVPSDFEGDIRSNTTPDIGADEGTFISANSLDCAVLSSPANALTSICPFETVQLSWTPPTSGRTLTGGYDIYLGTSNNPSLIGNTNNLTYTLPTLLPATTYYWKVIAKYASGDAMGCDMRSFTTSNTGITSLNGAQRCGPGVVNLTANGGGSMQWYTSAVATSPIYTGNTYSPNLAATTTYYVSALNGYGVFASYAGKPNIGASSSAGSSATEYLTFNALTPVMIDSVVVYPSSAGNVVLNLANSSGTVLLTATKAVTAGQIGLPVSMAVNWPVAAGTGYRIYKPATSVNLLRNISGAVYPYTLAGMVSVTGSSGGAAFYSWAYNWTVRAACASPRQAVTATITNTTSTLLTTSACNSYTWSASGLTYTTSGIYTHTALVSGGCTQTDSLVLTIGVAGNNPPLSATACASYYWALNGQTYTNSGTYTASFLNMNGCDSAWQLNLTIQSCVTSISLKLFLQGYYAGSGLMLPVLLNQGIGAATNITDFVNIELRNASNLSVAASTNAVLYTNGTMTANIAVTQGLYYIVVKHRNSTETWSASPMIIGNVPVNYDFTVAANKAFGDNMKEVEPGIWAFFTGDMNQDENIDLLDTAGLETDVNNFESGYFATDFNGDGNVDLLDAPLLEENVINFVSSYHP